MSLVTIAEVRALISTELVDDDLQVIIDRVESHVTGKVGAPQDDTGNVQIVKTLAGDGPNIFLPNEIASIVSIVEVDEGSTYTLNAYEYRTWGGGVIERLPEDSNWEDQVIVTYKPVDDRPQRKSAIIDLLRLELNRTTFTSESIAGEYAYSGAVDFEKERKRIMRRLGFQTAG
jgi:hypothetical protein